MITTEDVRRAFLDLQTAGFTTPPEWQQIGADRVVRGWVKDLSGMTADGLHQAVQRWKTSDQRFWPRPGQLYEINRNSQRASAEHVPYHGRQSCSICRRHTPGSLHLLLPVQDRGGHWDLEVVDLDCPCRDRRTDRTLKVMRRWAQPAMQSTHRYLVDDTPPSGRPGSNPGGRLLARKMLYNIAYEACIALGIDVPGTRYNTPRQAPDGQPLPPAAEVA